MTSTMIPPSLPPVRRIGSFNGRGLWTLYVKEVRRFLSVFTQTLLAPLVTTLLFLAIFTLALGGAGRQLGGVDYAVFLAPGRMDHNELHLLDTTGRLHHLDRSDGRSVFVGTFPAFQTLPAQYSTYSVSPASTPFACV